jgi:hypothetical protein
MEPRCTVVARTLALVTLAVSGAVLAAEPPPANPATATATTVAATADDPMICKRITVTGSRVKKIDTCRTRSQWAEVERKAKDYMRRIERSTSNQPQGLGAGS